MEISRDAYRAIEDIVGPENVTDDPAFLDSYAFEWLAEPCGRTRVTTCRGPGRW